MRATEWTYVKTGKVFIGKQLEAMNFFELSQGEFRKLRKADLIQMRRISIDEIELEEFVKEAEDFVKKRKADFEKNKKLRKKATREYYLQRAQALESEEEYDY